MTIAFARVALSQSLSWRSPIPTRSLKRQGMHTPDSKHGEIRHKKSPGPDAKMQQQEHQPEAHAGPLKLQGVTLTSTRGSRWSITLARSNKNIEKKKA